jgi:lysophospholipase L1-like esterase
MKKEMKTKIPCPTHLAYRSQWRSALSLLLVSFLFSPGNAKAQTAPPTRKAMKTSTSAPVKKSYKFDFGPGRSTAPGSVKVTPGIVYSDERGYGFEEGAATVRGIDRGGSDPLRADFCTSDQPFLFSVRLPEGNYRVTVTLGDSGGESLTVVKAELRRLMLEKVQTAPKQVVTRTFTVNTRTPMIPGGAKVRLKDRERETAVRNWDDRLTLEFNGSRPCVGGVEITPADNAVTVYLLGDSTVTDQPGEPWAAWGQMLPRFFNDSVAVANHAESGESLRSSAGAGRLNKVLSSLKAGDYVFIQFGHNDQKDKSEEAGAFTTYKADLKRYATEIRNKSGIPVLVTSMHRRRFDSDGKIVDTLGDYPEAVRQTAREEKLTLIDLNVMSRSLFEALGPDGSLKAFVHYPANTFPGQSTELKDNTHFNPYGAYELAKCIATGIRTGIPGLAKHLTPDFTTFDPARPDSLASWQWHASPARAAAKPDGS